MGEWVGEDASARWFVSVVPFAGVRGEGRGGRSEREECEGKEGWGRRDDAEWRRR